MGFNKPGGRRIGISQRPLKKVDCPKCQGTGDMSFTKTGVDCDKCHGTGKLTVDPGYLKTADLNEVDSIKTAWDDDTSDSTNDHCEKCYGEEYESGTGELRKYLGHDLCYRCFDKILSGKSNINDLEEMSTVSGVAGFNAPLGRTNKNRIKHNFSIKENTKMKTFKHILNEIDLSTKDKTLTQFLTQVSQTGELSKQFGANYKSETFMDWLRSKVENYGLSVSDKYLNSMESNIKNKTPNQAQMYVYNALLKGAGLGLTESNRSKKKLAKKFDEEI